MRGVKRGAGAGDGGGVVWCTMAWSVGGMACGGRHERKGGGGEGGGGGRGKRHERPLKGLGRRALARPEVSLVGPCYPPQPPHPAPPRPTAPYPAPPAPTVPPTHLRPPPTCPRRRAAPLGVLFAATTAAQVGAFRSLGPTAAAVSSKYETRVLLPPGRVGPGPYTLNLSGGGVGTFISQARHPVVWGLRC